MRGRIRLAVPAIAASAALVAIVALAACSGAGEPSNRDGGSRAATDAAAVSAAMDSVYDRFTRAYRLGEPDSVVALYTDSPLYLPGQGDILRGRAALRGAFVFLERIREDGGTAHIEFESVARHASGDLAFDIGYYTIRVEQSDGTLTPPNRGKFTTVWERGTDGRWRIRVDGFSPAPPPESSPE
ncbi:MAG: YybH family protein [Gemmatimonadota bacterium]